MSRIRDLLVKLAFEDMTPEGQRKVEDAGFEVDSEAGPPLQIGGMTLRRIRRRRHILPLGSQTGRPVDQFDPDPETSESKTAGYRRNRNTGLWEYVSDAAEGLAEGSSVSVNPLTGVPSVHFSAEKGNPWPFLAGTAAAALGGAYMQKKNLDRLTAIEDALKVLARGRRWF